MGNKNEKPTSARAEIPHAQRQARKSNKTPFGGFNKFRPIAESNGDPVILWDFQPFCIAVSHTGGCHIGDQTVPNKCRSDTSITN